MYSDPRQLSLIALRAMIPAWLILVLSLSLPAIDLGSPLSAWAVGWTNTGDVLGTFLLGLAMAGLLALRAELPWRRRLRELAIHIVVLALLQGGGALINEYIVKPSVASPRPNIVWLAEQDVLGMTAEQFYSSMDRRERSAALEDVLTGAGSHAIDLIPKVREHWIAETGYSLPSGHAFSSMLLATYFLAMGSSLIKRRWRRVFTLLPMWAILVSWSRVLLMVHRPLDVILGGLIGVVLGALAIVLARCLLVQLPLAE